MALWKHEPRRRRFTRKLTPKQFLKEVYREYVRDNVSDSAAILSYYFVFSLFPFLVVLATLTAYLPEVKRSVGTLLSRAHAILPPQAMNLIDQHVHGLINQPRPKLLTVGLLVTLYSASRGVDAVRRSLNLAYDVKESRPFWKTEGIAIGMTVGGALLVLLSVSGLIVGGDLGLWLAERLHIAREYVVVWSWLRWPITAAVIMLCAALGYYLLPDVEQRFKFITPGSVFGTLAWLGATWGFSQYAAHFGSYNVTYGSIGGVIVLMTWFYLSGFVFLMGGEINAILEDHAPDGKALGARVPGEAPPPSFERPSAMPPGATKRASAAEETPGGAVPPSSNGPHASP
ncbi:MAG TPA: YihY/virulence factor BrkB family protein [Polyangia bacterium]|jgi:membrane protein|nr:YihY/virulence factor BrkB family protein [Polyangia bacterium]